MQIPSEVESRLRYDQGLPITLGPNIPLAFLFLAARLQVFPIGRLLRSPNLKNSGVPRRARTLDAGVHLSDEGSQT